MERSQHLAERLSDLFLSGKWIANTNVKDQLLGIAWQQAMQKPHGLNSIAELTFHLNYYLAGVLQVLNGGRLDMHDKHSFNLPPISSEADWHQLVDELLSSAEAFVERTAQLTDEELDTPFADPKYGTNQRNIEAIIEHSYYHFGQISLLRKMTQD